MYNVDKIKSARENVRLQAIERRLGSKKPLPPTPVAPVRRGKYDKSGGKN